jgi:hypothetical protein
MTIVVVIQASGSSGAGSTETMRPATSNGPPDELPCCQTTKKAAPPAPAPSTTLGFIAQLDSDDSNSTVGPTSAAVSGSSRWP